VPPLQLCDPPGQQRPDLVVSTLAIVGSDPDLDVEHPVPDPATEDDLVGRFAEQVDGDRVDVANVQQVTTLTDRDRRLAEFLSLGHSGKHVAHKFGISPGRVTQLRQQWCKEWQIFQDAGPVGA